MTHNILDYLRTHAGELLVTFIGALSAVTLGSLSKGYMTALGKEAATKEDIRDVLEKLSAVTNTTKQIESKIDGALWEQQNRWQNKREFYLEIVVLVEKTIRALRDLNKLLCSGIYPLTPDQFEEQRGLRSGELNDLFMEVRMAFLKGRLFIDTTAIAAWEQMISEWAALNPPEKDPFTALLDAQRGRSIILNEVIKQERALTDAMIESTQKLQTELFNVAKEDLKLK